MHLEKNNRNRTEVETIRGGTTVTKAGSEIFLQNKTGFRLIHLSLSLMFNLSVLFILCPPGVSVGLCGSLWGLCGSQWGLCRVSVRGLCQGVSPGLIRSSTSLTPSAPPQHELNYANELKR